MSILPQELLDQVVDNLHDDSCSLKSCSLAASAFLSSARVHIFSSISLLPPAAHKIRNCQKFHTLLHYSPHLAPLVKDLRIVEGTLTVPPPSLRLGGTPWVAASGRILASILLRLKLTRFAMVRSATAHTGAVDYWDSIPHRLIAAIQDVLRSPHLESVRIIGIAQPPFIMPMLSDVDGLKELAVESLISEHTTPSNWRPRLEHLALVGSSTAEILLNSNIDLSHIKTLSLSGLSLDGSSISPLLKLMPGNNVVETLNIWYTMGIDYGQYPHEPLGIVGSLPCLRSLRVSGQLSILDLVAILDECCPHKSLERISFEASVEFLQTDDPIHWAEFHQIFLKFLPRRIFLHCSEKEGGKSCAGEYRTLLEERADLGTLIAQGELILQANHGYSMMSDYAPPC